MVFKKGKFVRLQELIFIAGILIETNDHKLSTSNGVHKKSIPIFLENFFNL